MARRRRAGIDDTMLDNPVQRGYLACGNTDMRKSIDGLAVLVKEQFELADRPLFLGSLTSLLLLTQ